MRKLNTSDVFSALRFIRAANLREEVKPLLKAAASGEASVEDVGIDGILTLIEALSEKRAEEALYSVLAGPLEVEAREVAAMELTDLADNLKAIAEENDLKTFFGYVSGILGKN